MSLTWYQDERINGTPGYPGGALRGGERGYNVSRAGFDRERLRTLVRGFTTVLKWIVFITLDSARERKKGGKKVRGREGRVTRKLQDAPYSVAL